MSKKSRKKWKNKAFSMLLIAAMLLEPATISSAAEVSGLPGEAGMVLETGQSAEPEENPESLDLEEESEPSDPEEGAEPSDSEESSEPSGQEESGPSDSEENSEPSGQEEESEPSDPEENPEPAQAMQTDVSEDGISGNDVGREADSSDDTADDFVLEGDVLVRYKGTASVVEIPEGVAEIKSNVFYGNENMEYVIFPGSLKCVRR